MAAWFRIVRGEIVDLLFSSIEVEQWRRDNNKQGCWISFNNDEELRQDAEELQEWLKDKLK